MKPIARKQLNRLLSRIGDVKGEEEVAADSSPDAVHSQEQEDVGAVLSERLPAPAADPSPIDTEGRRLLKEIRKFASWSGPDGQRQLDECQVLFGEQYPDHDVELQQAIEEGRERGELNDKAYKLAARSGKNHPALKAIRDRARQAGYLWVIVTRMKKNADWYVREERPVKAGSIVRRDTLVEFNCFQAGRKIKRTYRRVVVWLEEKQQELVLLTNRFDLAAETIAEIYKQRWQIELFFKAIKQNLRIKTFVGTSANAVRIQIWTALISMLLLKLLQFRSQIGWALSNLVALLRWNLFTHKDLWKWIDDPFFKPPDRSPDSLSQAELDGIVPT